MGAIKNLLQRLYPCGVCRTGTAVYLTFDDGPIPEVTPKVLEILARYNVKATFLSGYLCAGSSRRTHHCEPHL